MDQHVETRVGPVPVRSVGNGPPVLAVHGLLLDGRLWDATARHLAPHARALLPDLPLGSHRRAVPDRARLTPVDLAHALADLLDGLGIDRAVLVGNDTGGALAQIAAAAHPDRFAGIVLAGCDAFEHFPPPVLRPLPRLVRLPGLTRLALRALAVPPLLADPGPLNAFSRRGLGRALVDDLLAPARTIRKCAPTSPRWCAPCARLRCRRGRRPARVPRPSGRGLGSSRPRLPPP